MKNKLKRLGIFLLSVTLFWACSKDEVKPEPPKPKPQEGIATTGKIEVAKGIKAGSLTVNNGFNSSKVNDDGTFDIKTQKNITSVTNENGDVVYIYNKWLAESGTKVKTESESADKITPDVRETAKSIAFFNLGFAAISVDRDFTNRIGYLMETDPAIKPYIDKLEKVVGADIAENNALTAVTLTSNALELLNNSVKGALAIPKVVINAHDKLRNIVEYGYDNEYDVTQNTPYFLVQHKMENGSEDYYEKVDKFGSLKGNCVIKIRRAELQQDKSWRVKFDFYNKSPAYKYATEAKKENGENIYAKNVIKNVIYPYNSIGLLKDISSLSGISKLFKNYKDILENGILETEKYSTVSSKKSKVELDISEEKPYFYLGNARENNLLFAYAVVDIIANLSSATNDFVKAKLELIKVEKGEVEEDKEEEKEYDLIQQFKNHLKKEIKKVNEDKVGAGSKFLRNVLDLYKNYLEDNLTTAQINEKVMLLTIDFSEAFFKWLGTKAGQEAFEKFMLKYAKNKKVLAKAGYTKRFFTNMMDIAKKGDVSIDNLEKMTKNPFLKMVDKGLKFGANTIDLATFFFNINSYNGSTQVYLPTTYERTPKHLESVKGNALFSMDFKTNITIDASSKNQLLIRNADTHEVVLRYAPNELKISDNGQKLEFQLKGGLTKGNYYISIPEYLIFASGLTFQGIFTKNDWQFKYEGDEQGNYADKVFVKGGTFKMGSPNDEGYDRERPQHEVTVSDFYIGKYEVTNAQYAEFLNAKGNQSEGGDTWLDIDDGDCQIYNENGTFRVKEGKENYPVIEVTWYGARAYAQWVGGRLPTEAEWEYAARGGNKSNGYKYSGSNTIDDVAWYWNNSSDGTKQVGTKQANELGIYDMSGNVWEWCEDTWHDNYNGAPTDGTAWVDNSYSYRVLRGGSWNYDAIYCRVAYRIINDPYSSGDDGGFRVVFLP